MTYVVEARVRSYFLDPKARTQQKPSRAIQAGQLDETRKRHSGFLLENMAKSGERDIQSVGCIASVRFSTQAIVD
jgi:hypothetical protein